MMSFVEYADRVLGFHSRHDESLHQILANDHQILKGIENVLLQVADLQTAVAAVKAASDANAAFDQVLEQKLTDMQTQLTAALTAAQAAGTPDQATLDALNSATSTLNDIAKSNQDRIAAFNTPPTPPVTA